jgi:MFS family permease
MSNDEGTSLNPSFNIFPMSSRPSAGTGQDLALTTPTAPKIDALFQLSDASEHSIAIRKCRQQVLILVSCTALTITGCGFNFAFGVYEEHYEQIGGPFTIGAPFASGWTKVYGPRSVATLGGILFAVASISASFGTQLWHFQLTQGLLQGCAACLAYIPAVTISPAFFDTRRGLAMGIILSGTGLGGMLWAPFLRYLITEIGFRHTLRVSGVLAAFVIVTSAMTLEEAEHSEEALLRQAHGSRSRSIFPTINWKIILSKEFLAHASGTALQSAAYFIPVYFMSSYAGCLGYSNTSGARIIALSNACNFAGKIIIGYLADKLGRFNALVFSTSISASVNLVLWYISSAEVNASTSRTLFIIYATIYGLTAGSYVSLFPTVLVEQCGVLDFANVNGLLYMIRGFGTLVGTSIGGALIRKTKSFEHTAAYSRTFLFVSAMLFGTTISVVWARSIKLRGIREWRV